MSVLLRRKGVIGAMAAVASVVLAAGTAGCNNEPTEIDWPDDPTPRPAAAQPSDPPDAAEAQVAEEILALVENYREAEVATYADPQPPHLAEPSLGGYLADPQLSKTLSLVNDMNQAGIVFEGRPAWASTVAELHLDETPPVATVRDCVDATNWRSVFRESGNPVGGDTRPDHYVELLQMKQYDVGWLIYEIGAVVDETC